MSLTVRKVVSGFLQWAQKALASATVRAYRDHLDKWLLSLKVKIAAKLRPMHLTAWGKSWHEYQAVVRCFNWAVKEAKLIKVNPFAGLKFPPPRGRKRILSPSEMAGLLRSSSAAGRRFLLAMRETLARPQEIRLACWSDVQADDPALSVDEALEQGKALIVLWEYKARERRADADRPRVLLVNRRLGRLLARLRRGKPEAESSIFVNTKGEPWTANAIRCLLRRLRWRKDIKPDKHGENIVAYTFRHSTATLAAARGIRDRLLADLLGHTETRTTARYQHLQVQHLRDALDRIQADRS